AAVKLTHEGKEAAAGIRIAGVLAIIEVFCFAAALTKVDKGGQDYALLVASGFSATSACLTASTKAMTAMAEHAAQTLANLKAITGYLGGVSALISMAVDLTKTKENYRNKAYISMSLYAIKAVLGFAGGSANLLTAMSSSAPLIARIAGGKVAWLGKVGAGIEGAAARTEALAAGKAANVAVTTAMDAAAEEAGVVIGGRAGLLILGRAVLFLSGWEIAIVITVIQLLIAYLEDNDLQSWLEKCTFGKSPNSPPWSAGKQHEGFETALKAIGLQAEGSEK
ncbi:T6SS effector BTH_I2691 family protein, partial [Burkholderia glumae]